MFRRIIASFIVFLFIVLSLPIFYLLAGYATFSDKEFYTKDLVNIGYDYLFEESQGFFKDTEIENIESADFKDIFLKSILREDLENGMSLNLESLKKLEVNQAGQLEIKIPLTWTNRLVDNFAKNLGEYWYESLTLCAEENPIGWRELECLKGDIPSDDFEALADGYLDRMIFSGMPSSLDFNVEVPREFAGQNVLNVFDEILSKILLTGVLVLSFLLLLIGLLIFRPFKVVLKWIFKTLTLASLITLIFSTILYFVIPGVFETLFEEINMSIYYLFFNALSKSLLKIVVPLFIFSLGFWIVGIIYCRKGK
jgi:hypothetical protein